MRNTLKITTHYKLSDIGRPQYVVVSARYIHILKMPASGISLKPETKWGQTWSLVLPLSNDTTVNIHSKVSVNYLSYYFIVLFMKPDE